MVRNEAGGASGSWGPQAARKHCSSDSLPSGPTTAEELTEVMGIAGLRSCKLALEENLITQAEYDETKRTFLMAQRGQIMEEVKASLLLKKKLLEHEEKLLQMDGLTDLEPEDGEGETLKLESSEAIEQRRRDAEARRRARERERERGNKVVQDWSARVIRQARSQEGDGVCVPSSSKELLSPPDRPLSRNKRKQFTANRTDFDFPLPAAKIAAKEVNEQWAGVRDDCLLYYPSPRHLGMASKKYLQEKCFSGKPEASSQQQKSGAWKGGEKDQPQASKEISSQKRMGAGKEHSPARGSEPPPPADKKLRLLPNDKEPARMTKMQWATSLVGRRIEVMWKVNGGASMKFYLGTVYNYNRKMKKHQILYDDGDKGYVNLDPSKSAIYNMLTPHNMVNRRVEVLFEDPKAYYSATVTGHVAGTKSTYNVRYDDGELDELDLLDRKTKYRFLSNPAREALDQERSKAKGFSETSTQPAGPTSSEALTVETPKVRSTGPSRKHLEVSEQEKESPSGGQQSGRSYEYPHKPGYDLERQRRPYSSTCQDCGHVFASREEKAGHTSRQCARRQEKGQQRPVRIQEVLASKRVLSRITAHLADEDLLPFALVCRRFRQVQVSLVKGRRKKLRLRTNMARVIARADPDTDGDPVSVGYLQFLYSFKGAKRDQVSKRRLAILNYCAKEGHLDFFVWLSRRSGHSPPWDATTCAYAAWGGNLDVLQFLRQEGCEWDKETCTSAAGSGNLDVLQWARDEGCPWDYWQCYYSAQAAKLRGLGEVEAWVASQIKNQN
ncbi:F-box domain-containing protein [Chloropicon roscoffensis]|uniref:F-box domain-containing protein n=2 Tax=Chloropicon roscoffensis TaxID=1461544 RepID=A0AAX4PEW4_9CHLO